MAEGTSAGSVFIDLVIRDNTEKQIQQSAERAQQSAQKTFSTVEQAAQKMADTVTAQTAKTVQNVTQTTAKTVQQAFDKSVALAEAKVYQLGEKLEATTAKLWDTQHNDSTFKVHGYVSEGNKEYTRLLKEQERLTEQLNAAEERLDIERQAAAQRSADAARKAAQKQEEAARKAAEKQEAIARRVAEKQEREVQRAAAAAQKAAMKQAQEAEKAAQKAAAAAEKAALKREAAAQKAAAAEARAAQKAAEAEEKAANRRKAIHAKMWKNMLSKAGASAKSMLGKLTGIGKGYDRAGKATSRFGSRLREIASGALIFNGISAALRSVVNYFGKTIASTDQMRSALANLKGAAANAASPIIQVLTPALTALANAAATVFSYVASLLTALTGKVSTAASTVTKGAGAAKKALASLAGFDEIQKLDGQNDGSGGGSETVTPNYDFQDKSPFLDDLLAAIKAGQWKQVGQLLARKINDSLAAINWEKIQTKATQWTRNLVDTINGFVHELDFDLLGRTIGNGLNTIGQIIDTFYQGVDWVAMGEGFGTGLNGLFDTVDWAMLGRVLTDKLKALFGILYGFVQTFDFAGLGSDLSQMIMAAVGNIDWAKAGEGVSSGIIGIATTISVCLKALDWQQIGRDVEAFLASVDWSGMVRSIVEGIGAAVGGLAATLWEIIGDEWNSMVDTWLENSEKCGGDVVAGLLLSILEGLANISQWIIDNIFTPFIDGFCEAFGIHSPSTVMEEQGGFIIEGLLNGITTAWENVKTFFGTALEDIKSKLSEAFNSIRDTAADIWENGIVPAIKNPINAIIGCINGMISGVVSGINTMIRALNRIHFDIPEWVPGMGGKSFGFSLSEMSTPQIPMLAGGGVIKQPTLAMMGEYSGAQNNPEIVAPQSIIEETVASVLGGLTDITERGFETVVGLLREILEVVLGIEIDGETLSRAVENYKRKMAAAKGGA
ncbi:MAG: hypothetical protein IJ960_06725 [Oscillospiraceae bacterium]|nr:hypothetical protein [Oscillospiraceae bacterium]